MQGGRYPYVYLDGIYLRRNWGGEYENVAILVAIAMNEDGYREVLGASEGMKEDKASWVNFLQWLKGRGLEGVKLIVSDKCLGMLEAVGGSLLRRKISALHCSFLPKCVTCSTAFKGEAGGKDAQGDPCSGKQESRA